MQVYFDNTASTPIAPEVIDLMVSTMKENYGNPSSIHNFGRKAKVAIENARKKVAKYLNASPAEIIFTSGGTEANNTAIRGAVLDMGIKHIITSAIEHPAVLETVNHYASDKTVTIDLVNISEAGRVDTAHLDELLSKRGRCLVSLMHANNEIATLLPMKDVSALCRKYNALFHSDMVQTMGHYSIDMQVLDVDFASCSAHKFHGPKGAGFLYYNSERVSIKPLLYGGAQERNMRGGTENLYGIVGLAKAFELANENMKADSDTIRATKKYMVDELEKNISAVDILGESRTKGLYTILNVLFPATKMADMLIMNLDIAGISASSGSACASGTNLRSHVLDAIAVDEQRPAVRFSFSKYNTFEEVDYCIKVLKDFFK